MNRYYDILKLKLGEGIKFDKNFVTVDLSKVTNKDVIQNDDQFNANLHPNNYFFMSGGGSFLLKNRFLLTVKRSPSALVNPGKISLFTGRAEGPHEWNEPRHVVRELFEEILLFDGLKILYPRFMPYQEIIDEVYKIHFKDVNLRSAERADLQLEEISMSNCTLKILNGEQSKEDRVFIHINSRNDINILSLFLIDVDPERLMVRDAEESNFRRDIFLLDTETECLREVGKNSADKFKTVSRIDMTEHLCAMLDSIIAKKKNNAQPFRGLLK